MRKYFYLTVFFITLIAFTNCHNPRDEEVFNADSTFTINKNEPITDSNRLKIINNECCVEIPPKFQGGLQKLNDFLIRNIIYPDSSKKAGVEGTVIVSFVIEKDGKVSSLLIERGLTKEIDQEVLRVFSKMPNWIPATCSDNYKIRFPLRMPVEFKLE